MGNKLLFYADLFFFIFILTLSGEAPFIERAPSKNIANRGKALKPNM